MSVATYPADFEIYNDLKKTRANNLLQKKITELETGLTKDSIKTHIESLIGRDDLVDVSNYTDKSVYDGHSAKFLSTLVAAIKTADSSEKHLSVKKVGNNIVFTLISP